VTVVSDDGTEETHTVATIARLEVADGQEIKAGDPIIDGPRDPKDLLEIKGVRETQQYLVEEVQRVYRDQGVSIADKHIELIVRQMTRRVGVHEPGDSTFLPGENVDAKLYADVNRQLVQEDKTPAEGRPVMMGITKASLATDSWLSAASFQETTRVLTEAAIESRSDSLLGLKENIIIGKLIPAGTGTETYRAIETEAPDYQPMEFWSSDREEQGLAEWLAGSYETSAGDGAVLGGNGEVAEIIGLPSPDDGAADTSDDESVG
jgi:DNA-directed RNA polymerase subunit beta'